MAKKPASEAITEAAAAINTLSMDAGVGGKLAKGWATLRARRIYQVPAVPTAVQTKGDHMQIRFGGLYVSRTLGYEELQGVDKATFRLEYEKAKATGQTSPSFSGSGEAYVPLTVTDEHNGGGFVSLGGVTVMTFEVDPSIDLTPKHDKGVYHEDPDTGGDGDDDGGDDDGDGDDD